MRTLKFLTVITIFLVMFSCSNTPSGSEYLGKWTHDHSVMSITKVGESFLVESFSHKNGIYTITKENNLVQSGIMGTTITYDKNTNTLIVSSGDDIDRWTSLQAKSLRISAKIKDIDGNVYTQIKIGEQVWMVENLKTTKFNDGSRIANITSKEQWNDASRPGYCWYDNDIDNKNTYGALYNWYAVESGILCPKGWHVPRYGEWTTLTEYLFGEHFAGGEMKEAGTIHWESPNEGATNSSGFTALPGGYRGYRYGFGSFYDIGHYGYWWSSTEYDTDYTLLAWYHRLSYNGSYVYSDSELSSYGFSVRCIRD